MTWERGASVFMPPMATCGFCDEPASEAVALFTCVKRGKRVNLEVDLCDEHGEQMLKHLKRAVPGRLFAVILGLCLFASPLYGQTRADSARTELVRARGFIRASETQLTKVLALLSPPAPGPAVVLDWRTGEWNLNVGGYPVTLDLEARLATIAGVTAPVTAVVAGDTLRVRLAVPGYEGGLVEVVHAEGRLIGTVTHNGETRQAAGQRPSLSVVRTVAQAPCTFAQFTDGSWGVSPNTEACHKALDAYAGPLQFTAREYVP